MLTACEVEPCGKWQKTRSRGMDVTNTVDVTCPVAVTDALMQILTEPRPLPLQADGLLPEMRTLGDRRTS